MMVVGRLRSHKPTDVQDSSQAVAGIQRTSSRQDVNKSTTEQADWSPDEHEDSQSLLSASESLVCIHHLHIPSESEKMGKKTLKMRLTTQN